ncbi:MAG: ABC transporter substrate-binding protein, partial [Bacillota bacterium]
MRKDAVKLIRVVIISAIFSALLTTCNIGFEDLKDGVNSNAYAKKELPYYNIVWYHANTPQSDTALVFEEVNKYLNKKINASVEVYLADLEDYDKKLKAVISSGEKFDICFTSVWMNSYVHNSKRGSFVELDPLLDKYGRATKSILPKVLLDATRVNGKLYGIPVNKQLAHQWAISFNKKLVDKYGFDLSEVKKLEDMESMLEVIKGKEPEVVPYLIYTYVSHAFSLPMERIDEQVPSALYFDNRTNYKLINTFESPEFKEYLSLMRRWYNKGYILEDAASLNNVDYYLRSGNWF